MDIEHLYENFSTVYSKKSECKAYCILRTAILCSNDPNVNRIELRLPCG